MGGKTKIITINVVVGATKGSASGYYLRQSTSASQNICRCAPSKGDNTVEVARAAARNGNKTKRAISFLSYIKIVVYRSPSSISCIMWPIGEGGDVTISSPGRSPKQSLPGIGLHDLLHGRQACPEFITFDQGSGQICSR